MKRKTVIAAAVAAALVTGGTATALGLPSDDSASGPAATAVTAADATRAAEKAASAVPGTVTGLDLEDDGHEWDVDVFGKDGKWHEVTLDPAGTKVLRDHVETGPDTDDRDRHAPKNAPVTVQRAMEAALGATPGRVTEAGLEQGRWEIEIQDARGAGHDVTVDAKTGRAAVVPQQQDGDASDERADDASDERAADTADASDGRAADSTDASDTADAQDSPGADD
ncbi:PepSY domain-containing protein [Streptomyces candidus]|uniref:Putative membrane protein YkoI n=1 Tax=Streptomyces candidus TaxID=67283 RepID=A0A7X0LR08_9ACTN|nr:PepSY domain-containing protein [Streptomyces candidus]MBB6437622.1 putative membrane protein YkoI [Streptomyces candidus]GHH53577.1 hypothetical protein GCM10018773_55310 [Streptomyces candidus]